MATGKSEPMFADRADAGARLGARLRERGYSGPTVLGMARGGLPVAAAVAAALNAPLDVAVARKIGAPGRPEFGLGAVTAHGRPRYDRYTLRALGLSPEDLRADCERERAEARRRIERCRQVADPVPVDGRDVVLVDDGLATGVTARAALDELRAADPHRLVFAAPVCAPESQAGLDAEGDADEVVCLAVPDEFGAVGLWYREFGQTSDDEVLDIPADARRAHPLAGQA